MSAAMEPEQALAFLLLYRRLKKRRRTKNRTLWVHRFNMERNERGAFHVLFDKLREDGSKFSKYFGMSISSFDELHDRLRGSLQRKNTFMRECIPPIQMLAVAIRYLASGKTFTDLHRSYRLGVSTIGKIVRDVCSAIWSVRDESIPAPSNHPWQTISEKFERDTNFPHCIGAVAGKLAKLTGTARTACEGVSSVVLVAVADSEYRFVYVDIACCGEDCDADMFKNSPLWSSIKNNEAGIPRDRCLPGTSVPTVPYFLVGDEAFGLDRHLIRPYGGSNLTEEKRVFNYRLSGALTRVQCAFGILSNKWRIFHRPLNLKPDFAVDVARACVVLHNFVLDRDGYEIEDLMSITGLRDIPGTDSVRGGTAANNIRKTLADYFTTPAGSLQGQLSRI